MSLPASRGPLLLSVFDVVTKGMVKGSRRIGAKFTAPRGAHCANAVRVGGLVRDYALLVVPLDLNKEEAELLIAELKTSGIEHKPTDLRSTVNW